ncbi:hypothetical protein FB451DRAFT_1565845 [Mycena latifolia]|nr:hypothetical protein FB451DRAFT_1565845 [Mycena latifolia]
MSTMSTTATALNGDGRSVDAALPGAEHPLTALVVLPRRPRPASPTKPKPDPNELKPTAHPYPIKTTATALLSCSNSTSGAPAARHHYIPQTPPSSAASPAREGARRGSTAGIGGGVQGPRVPQIPPNVRASSLASTIPKRWTPAELAAHLGNTVSRETGECVVRRGVGGHLHSRAPLFPTGDDATHDFSSLVTSPPSKMISGSRTTLQTATLRPTRIQWLM